MVWWAIWVPPIQGPDEGAHLARADQISHGGFVGQRLTPALSGGKIDTGVIELIGRFYSLPDHPEKKADPRLYSVVPWGVYGNWGYPNTAIYPPIFYLPAAAALYAGRTLGLDVLQSTEFARLSLGAVAVPCAAAAIFFAGPAAIYLFTLLLLPSSLQLMTQITQDGGILVSAAAIGVLCLHGGRRSLWAGAALLALIACCRPPYAALSLLTLAWPGQSLRRRAAACALAALGAFAWIEFTKFFTYVDFPPTSHIDAAAQAALLLKHPFMLAFAIERTVRLTFASDLAPYFVSLRKLPGFYTWSALTCIGLAISAAWRRPSLPAVAVWGVAASAAATGIFAAEYITWTPVGFAEVWGVQGRYFLPIMATLPVCISSGTPDKASVRLSVQALLLAFPLASIGVTLWVFARIY